MMDVGVVLAGFYGISYGIPYGYVQVDVHHALPLLTLSTYVLFYNQLFELYHLQKASQFETVVKGMVLSIPAITLSYLLTPWVSPVIPRQRIEIVLFVAVLIGTLGVWRWCYAQYLASHRFRKRIALIAPHNQQATWAEGLRNEDPHFQVVLYCCPDALKGMDFKTQLQQLENWKKAINDAHIAEIVVALPESEWLPKPLTDMLMAYMQLGLPVREYSQVYEERTHRLPIPYLSSDFYRLFPFGRNHQNRLYGLWTNILDGMAVGFGLVLLTLLTPVLWLLNLFFNPGPLMYKQQRVGQFGQVFWIYKFRTMVPNAETSGAVFAQANDHRITPFGRWLRRTRIDEIPQCYNIWRGEMSLIGPRPERPVFVEQIRAKMPLYDSRHVVKPGISGWAQVKFSYGESIDDSLTKLEYDLYYIKHRSLWLDLVVLLKTLNTVLFHKGQ